MVSYTVLKSGGDPIGTDRHMSIYLYPDTYSEDSVCENGIASALDNACSEFLRWNVIGYYEIAINYDHPSKQDENSSTLGYYNDFKAWIQDNGNYLDYKGSHIGINDKYGSGQAQGGDGPSSNSFVTSQIAVMGTNAPTGHYENGAIMEALHNFINENNDRINDELIEDDEHDLGTVHSGGNVTPLTTSYVGPGDHSQHGYCDKPYSQDGYTHVPTECTVNAIDYTANEAGL